MTYLLAKHVADICLQCHVATARQRYAVRKGDTDAASQKQRWKTPTKDAGIWELEPRFTRAVWSTLDHRRPSGWHEHRLSRLKSFGYLQEESHRKRRWQPKDKQGITKPKGKKCQESARQTARVDLIGNASADERLVDVGLPRRHCSCVGLVTRVRCMTAHVLRGSAGMICLVGIVE